MTCHSPNYLLNKAITGITEDLMNCGERDIQEEPELDITPDVKYRNIE